MKTITLLLLLALMWGCREKENQRLAPQWFSRLEGDKSAIDIQHIIYSPDELTTAFANLKESTFEDTTLLKNFIPSLRFEFYNLPEGPGIIFNPRCAEASGAGVACIPLKDGCQCIRGKETGDIIVNEPPVRHCELVTEKFTGKKFCEGNCKDGRECIPLVMYSGRFRQSGGVAGCLCWPLPLGRPQL